jgi:hypothetical protein
MGIHIAVSGVACRLPDRAGILLKFAVPSWGNHFQDCYLLFPLHAAKERLSLDAFNLDCSCLPLLVVYAARLEYCPGYVVVLAHCYPKGDGRVCLGGPFKML